MRLFFTLICLSMTFVGWSQYEFQKPPNENQYPVRGSVIPITAGIAYQGYDESQAYFGEGEYEIFLDVVDGVLDAPIIVLDGFDPGDGRDISGLYASLGFGGENLADILRAEGYDIVILNAPQYTTGGKFIDGGADYIQRNAMVLIALIQEINAQKQGDEELVVLGPSMGGLIARYALAYMEDNSLEHETRLYISFDSPHRGANIPISLQYLINYFAQQVGDPTAIAVVDDLLNSPAAKEMLIDHLLGHLLLGSPFEQDPTKLLPEGAPNFRDAFQGELDALGFPQNVRNVTMINGSGNGTTTGTPGMTLVDTNLQIDVTTDVDVALKFTPAAGQTNTATDITVNFFGIPIETYEALAESTAASDGVDSSPGGTASVSAALGGGGGNPVLQDFIDALQQDTYSFIPTMSALAIDNPDWFAIPDVNDSPFVNYYIPNENEDHVTVTAESAQFALDEIRQTLGVSEATVEKDFYLLQNPIEGQILLKVPMGKNTISASIFSLTGQEVATKNWSNPSSRMEWEVALASGVYLLQVSDGNSQETLKLIVQ